MKTVISKDIDGYNIIHGFSDPVVDPVSTQNAINNIVNASAERQAFVDAEHIMREKIAILHKLELQASRIDGDDASFIKAIDAARTIRDETVLALKSVISAARAATVIYFTPRDGEEMVSDEVAAPLEASMASLEDGHLLQRNGESMQDNRGKKYADAGDIKTIVALGEKVIGPITTGLGAADEEAAIISTMSAEQKADKSAADRKSYMHEAIGIKIAAEIDNDADPLGAAQAFLAEKDAMLAIKYA